jgi:hypothetical protein
MKKSKLFLLAVMFLLVATAVFASRHRKFVEVDNWYIYYGSSYLELASDGAFANGFTTTGPGGSAPYCTISDASGYPYVLYTYYGST